ncbi:UNVERIFIED_CONTAM: hypothetical protein Sradi_5880100 [Sesamum radiatum]|uniref:Uncharacterized protein n=1 Tax=Sesamum radiatum TaxID=300843 RepID=A0AAW2KRZ5_SESRA
MYVGRRLEVRDLIKSGKTIKQRRRRPPAQTLFSKEGVKHASSNKIEPNDPPRKGVVMDDSRMTEAMEDTSLIQFERTEKSGSKTHHNDALVITALLANYEVGRIFIDFGSSTYILFWEAYDQMQLGDIPLEKVNTSLYGFAREIIHPRGMISLFLMLGTQSP